jgi:hypothetical protein
MTETCGCHIVQGFLWDSHVTIYKTYIGETHYKSWLDFSQHASIPRHHLLCVMSPSTIRHVIIHSNHIFMSSIDFLWLIACISHHKIPADNFRMIHSQQNNMLSYIMSSQTNIFGVTTFTFHLKILFKKFSQQRAGYHLVQRIFVAGEVERNWTSMHVSTGRRIIESSVSRRAQGKTAETKGK